MESLLLGFSTTLKVQEDDVGVETTTAASKLEWEDALAVHNESVSSSNKNPIIISDAKKDPISNDKSNNENDAIDNDEASHVTISYPQARPSIYHTFLEVRFPQHPPFPADDTASRTTIALQTFTWMMNHIWQHDPFAVLLPYPPGQTTTNKKDKRNKKTVVVAAPIDSKSPVSTAFPTSVREVSNYVMNFWIYPTGSSGKGRICLYHSKDITLLVGHLNSQGYFQFYQSQFQSADVARTVWLKGTTASTNCNDLAAIILKTPQFQERPDVHIVIRQKPVKLYLLEKQAAEHQAPFAAHVYTVKENCTFVRDTLIKLYNNKPTVTPEFPFSLPLHGKYLAMTDATSHLAEPETRQKLMGQRRHQKAILRNTITIQKDLYGLIPYEGSRHLRPQLLAEMTTRCDSSVVMAVDRHPLRAFTYIFSFHHKHKALAVAAIDAIVSKLIEESVSGIPKKDASAGTASFRATPAMSSSLTTTAKPASNFSLVPSSVRRKQAWVATTPQSNSR